MLGFILMIVVAAYTANLAAFITVSALPAPGSGLRPGLATSPASHLRSRARGRRSGHERSTDA